jgi:hypothetical protein
MTVGNGGNDEGLYMGWVDPQPSWSGYRESVWGYSTIEVLNSTHLHWQMKRANDSLIRDDYWIKK